jgi:4-phospho-D-threonate 3-dehydrogenase / 4-phospho-D-erythronate 3-dehydrogenase
MSGPLVGLTMGDVAGIGPEVIAAAWADPRLHALARPFVIGDSGILERALALRDGRRERRVQVIAAPEEAAPSPILIPCLSVAGDHGDLAGVVPGRVDPRAGRAAAEFLKAGAALALAGRIDAITTLPINKKALSESGISHPGHTEILAELCGAPDHAMMLYLETEVGDSRRSQFSAFRRGSGLGVVHVTLHVALRRVFELLTTGAIVAKIRLADRAVRPLTGGLPPRIAVSSLNPHAGEDGLFGDEEDTIIAPAVTAAGRAGIDVSGPFPNDTLFHNALAGAYDAVVAMHHDQGHIALKTVGFERAVNVTLGLPIVRTSVAHGTAFDIAWQGVADPSSLIEAVRVAARIVAGKDLARSSTAIPAPRAARSLDHTTTNRTTTEQLN